MTDSDNNFTFGYYRSIIKKAQEAGYTFMTLREYYDSGCPPAKHFILRHDLDLKPAALKPMLDVEIECNVRSSIFVRVHAEYNLFDPRVYDVISLADSHGFEIGLHANFVEFATVMGLPVESVLKAELRCVRSFFPSVDSIACHRDVNYVYNSLPWLEEHWDRVKFDNDLHYQTYDEKFKSAIYVNEGLNPHLCWRSLPPERIIEMGHSIYMLTHPHWWFQEYPHEHWS